MSERAGTIMFAPQARLVDCTSGRIIGTTREGGQAAGPGPERRVTSPDLVTAEITLLNTGISQLEVTLNNQRFDPADGRRPIFPPWKYNDFSSRAAGSTQDSAGTYALTFGQRIRLDVRYGDSPWTKMILGRITDLQFTFPTEGGAQVKVVAEDMLSVLKIRPERNHPYPAGQQEEDILDEVIGRSRLGITYVRAAEGIERRQVGLRAFTHDKSKTYFAFITEIADRLDAELFVDFVARRTGDTTAAINVAQELRVRMQPARSTIAPTIHDDDWSGPDNSSQPGRYLALRWGRNLVSFEPKFKVWEMPTRANTSGSQPDRRGRADGVLTSAEIQTALRRELPASPSYDVQPIDAITARRQFFGDASDAEDNTQTSHSSNLDRQRNEMKALAEVLKKVREFMTVEASTIGIPKLRPGMYVHILGLRPPFDGFYYVVKTVHSLDETGYRTGFTLRRPGMLPPSAYLNDSTEEIAEAAERRQLEASRAAAAEGGAR